MRVAIMPARGGSKRIKNKNITDFCGQPLMAYALRAAQDSGLFNTIHVSTEDDAIAAVATEMGFPPEFRRDPALADDFTPLLPVLKWTLERYAERGKYFDSVCLLMPTAPLIDADDLKAAAATFDHHDGKKNVLAISDFPVPIEWAFRLKPSGVLQAVSPSMSQVRSQDLPVSYYDSGTFIFFTPDAVLTGKEPEYIGHPIPRSKAVDIDTPEDFAMAELLFRGMRSRKDGA